MRVFFIAAVLVAGCRQPVADNESLCRCFVGAAYAVVKAERPIAPAVPAKCCRKCTKGKVLSGDGFAMVDCPCPPGCKCKEGQ